MANRSCLFTPGGNYECRYYIGLGWMLLFEKNDIEHNFKEALNDVEDIKYNAMTIVEKAASLLDARLTKVVSPYLKEVLQNIEPLREALEISPRDGRVTLECQEFMMMMTNEYLIEYFDIFDNLPDMVEKAISQEDPTDFFELLYSLGVPDLEFTGDIVTDQQKAEEFGLSFEDILLGHPT